MIDTNSLKIIAIIAMIIDHIGSYFVAKINPDLYYAFRSIGRIVMPIFLYLLVQGFFHTKNIKKYIFRVFCLATITQIILLLLGIINQIYFTEYNTRVNEYIGILYSYTLSLIFISITNKKSAPARSRVGAQVFYTKSCRIAPIARPQKLPIAAPRTPIRTPIPA